MRRLARLLAVAAALTAVPGAFAQPRVLDAFADVSAWRAVPADGVTMQITPDRGAMRLDVAFTGGGYAIARRALPLTLPGNYRFSWRVRAEGPGGTRAPVNDLEFKLVDASGDNVWWHNRRRFAYPLAWQTLTTRQRHVEFAWGPQGGGPARDVAFVEFVVTAAEGGRATVWIDDFTVEPLPPDGPYTGTPRVTADRGTASGVLAGTAPWIAPARTAANAPASAPRTLTLDFGTRREFGGLTLDWAAGQHATAYTVETSNDGRAWERAYTAAGAALARQLVPLGETEARYVRLRTTAGAAPTLRLDRLTVEPIAFSASPNAFAFARTRAAARRGLYPQAFTDSVMTYWTVTGLADDPAEALVGQNGDVEVGRAFTLEPFLHIGGRLRGWADGAHTASLVDGDLPMPVVERRHASDSLSLTVRTWTHDADGAPLLAVEYVVRNDARAARTVPLVVALRPFQVNPPWQWLNQPGGAGSVRTLAPADRDLRGALVVNDTIPVLPLLRPDAVATSTFSGGDLVERIDAGVWPAAAAVRDSLGLASAAWRFDLDLAPRAAQHVRIYVPLRQAAIAAGQRELRSAAVRVHESATRQQWRERLDRVRIDLPDRELVETMRAQIGYVLVNRDGPRVQPGSRSYERSWIRDGSLTSAALLRLGLFEEVKRFLRWYAPYQFESGRVPCCVDSRGADPTAEHDSHGQLVYAVADVVRVTGDDAFGAEMWPHVARAVDAMEALRAPQMTDAYTRDTLRAYYGMLPASISHEGYSAKPMHSYWDAAFALRGYKDAAWLAAHLGRTDSAAYRARADAFRADVVRSFALAMAKEGIDYLPGSVELGDFDATSTTVFIAPGGEQHALPPDALRATFDRYWANFTTRRETGQWENYTPYEWRVAGTFVRLGQPERAWQIFDWFFGHRRPAGFRHWAEVVWNDPDTPRFIGDMPHTWVGTDFVRSTLDLFAYEDEALGALVVGAGLRPEWLDAGVGVTDLHTAYGRLSYRARRGPDGRITVSFTDGADAPAGLVVRLPGRWRSATADGRAVPVAADGSVALATAPAALVLVPAD